MLNDEDVIQRVGRESPRLRLPAPASEERRASGQPNAGAVHERKRLDDDSDKMPLRCRTVEHPFGTIKAWMGATTLKHVATEMALHVLAYNLKRVMAILGVPKLLGAM